MRQRPHTLRKAESAFTLIEVMLAVSIAAIGIIAILGLLPGAIRSGRDAADNTLSSTIAQDVFNNIRGQPLDAVDFGDGSGAHPMTNGAYTTAAPLTSYFDYTGAPTNSASAYYKVLVSSQQTSAPLPLWAVRVAVLWPAPSPLATSNVFVSYVAPYGS